MSKIVLENDTDPTVNKSNLKLDDDLKKPSYFIRIPILCVDLILVGLISLLGILIVPDQFLNNEIINIVLVAFPVIFWIIYSILTGILFKQSIGHLVLGTTLNTKSRFQAIFAILFSPTLFTDILLNIKITRLKKPPILIRLTTILASLSSLVIIPGLLLYTLSFLVILAEEAPLFFDNSISTSQIPLKGSIESTSITPSTIKSDQLKQPEENKKAPKSDQGSTELKKENKVIQQTAPKETIQDIKLRQLEREKAELEKQAEKDRKTAEYYKGVENFREEERKKDAERAKEKEKRNLELEAERIKRNEELEAERLAEELARAIEQEERLAEQQYNSCISDLNYCIDNAPRQVSRLGNTSAYAPALNAVVRECQRKYQCSR
jgi:hypothetical protein